MRSIRHPHQIHLRNYQRVHGLEPIELGSGPIFFFFFGSLFSFLFLPSFATSSFFLFFSFFLLFLDQLQPTVQPTNSYNDNQQLPIPRRKHIHTTMTTLEQTSVPTGMPSYGTIPTSPSQQRIDLCKSHSLHSFTSYTHFHQPLTEP